MSKSLGDIRKKIDTLDNKIHDVLMQRAELIDDIITEKRKHNLQFVHPAREAQMIRRLLARHDGSLPAAAIIRIWRELVGAVSLLQTGLKVSVYTPEGNTLIWDHSKAYFGSVVAMQRIASPLVALSSVREGESSFAVLPWPQDNEEPAWWTYLMDPDSDIKIVCVLPYGTIENKPEDTAEKAVVISKIGFNPSGEDHSFIAMEIDRSVSRGRIVDALKALSFDPLSVTSLTHADAQGHSMHLVEADDYLADDDERLTAFCQSFEGLDVRVKVLGGYPVPPVLSASNFGKMPSSIPSAPPSEKTAKKK
ncbi:MAG: chorismate mutase [Alphaproteobacteria bacterium]|nr:chorismate mutase [Alphaproteobacteria bacterium]